MNTLAILSNLAGPDLIVLLLIVLVLFGAKKLPALAKGMGQAVREFQKAKDEFTDELHQAGKVEPKPERPVAATVARLEDVPASVAQTPVQNNAPGDHI